MSGKKKAKEQELFPFSKGLAKAPKITGVNEKNKAKVRSVPPKPIKRSKKPGVKKYARFQVYDQTGKEIFKTICHIRCTTMTNEWNSFMRYYNRKYKQSIIDHLR